jgi:predicted enzyme related to lactoylglutathione lyase
MHKSRLGTLIIDCQGDDFDRAVAFWSAALGCAEERSDDPASQNYVKLQTGGDDVTMLLQKVDHPSRVHLDIESDDIDAEVQRLEKLGAKRIAQIKGWWVLEAPSGHRFCVVKPQRRDFAEKGNQWD